MSAGENLINTTTNKNVRVEKTFQRFTLAQRWEHALIIFSFSLLLLTGLPQKYRTATWSQQILSTPERLDFIQQIHHFVAIILIAEVLYHLVHAVSLLIRKKMPADIFPTWKDVRDAWQMIKYLLFLSKAKPLYGKYNFEQKLMYWFIFIGVGVMVVTGIILWFPIMTTQVLPGGIVPAAKLAHSTEAIVAAVFIIVWHFFHVHFERLNLSMFTGRLSEEEMREYHSLEFNRLNAEENLNNSSRGENESK